MNNSNRRKENYFYKHDSKQNHLFILNSTSLYTMMYSYSYSHSLNLLFLFLSQSLVIPHSLHGFPLSKWKPKGFYQEAMLLLTK